ncbi:hypothetical protein K501DRAFT_283620 [Backusella circina FSU 941]|nr:hypothetical protein K501DRAFT_283620 [Backusella circina FSU 941]
MLSKVLIGRLLTNTTRTFCSQSKNTLTWAIKRNASTTSTTVHSTHLFDMSLGFKPLKETTSAASVSEYVSRLRPFSAPPAPAQQPLTTPTVGRVTEELELTSVLRKRRLKMNKHKHKKLRKRTRALRKRLGK